jgi:hypothetical protein
VLIEDQGNPSDKATEALIKIALNKENTQSTRLELLSDADVFVLPLQGENDTPIRVLKTEDTTVENRIPPQPSIQPGISSLTFEHTLPLAYIESKINLAITSMSRKQVRKRRIPA